MNKLTIGGSNSANLSIMKKGSENLECPKSPGRLIKSPKTGESRFVSAITINKSPQMQSKTLSVGAGDKNYLDKLAKKKAPSITIGGVSAAEQEKINQEEEDKLIKLVRKGVVDVRVSELKNSITQVQNPGDLDDLETSPSSDVESNEVNYEGYLYKLTKTKKLKKMYFRLIHKDMYCKSYQ